MEHASSSDAALPSEDQAALPSEDQAAEIKRQIAAYNAARSQIYRNGVLRVALTSAGLAILVAGMLYLGLAPERGTFAALMLFTSGPVGFLGLWLGLKWAWQPVRDHARSLRYQILPIAFGFVERLRYRYGVSPGHLEGARRLGLVHFTRSDTADSIEGRHDDLTFALALTRLTTGSGKTERTVFRGLVLHAVLTNEFPGRIVVARRNGNWLADVVNALFPGKDAAIATGIEELDETYAISTDNRMAAELVLETRLVPLLQFLRRIWRGADIRIAVSQRECYLMLASEREFFILPGPREDVDFDRHVKPMISDLVEMLAVARLLSKL